MSFNATDPKFPLPTSESLIAGFKIMEVPVAYTSQYTSQYNVYLPIHIHQTYPQTAAYILFYAKSYKICSSSSSHLYLWNI